MNYGRMCFAVGASLAFASSTFGMRLVFNGQSNTDSGNTSTGEQQLTVDMFDTTSTRTDYFSTFVQFVFQNTGPTATSLEGIFFSSGDIFNGSDDLFSFAGNIIGSTGVVAFSEDNPAVPFPGAPTGFNTTHSFSAFTPITSRTESPWGIDPGESLTILFQLAGDLTLQDMFGFIESGDLQIGLRTLNPQTGAPETFLNDSNIRAIVPLPSGAALACVGLGGLAVRRRR